MFQRCRGVRPFLFTLFCCLPVLRVSAQAPVLTTHIIPLGVQDHGRRFVGEITPQQIRIKGVSATVRRVELDNAPRRIVLLLDASGSMGDYKTASWQNATQMAIQFVSRREGTDVIALHTFSNEHQVLVPFTLDSQFLIQQIRAITSSGRGRTMLGKALAEILASKTGGLKFGDVIILVSDGEYTEADKTDIAKLPFRLEFIRAGLRVCLLRVPSIANYGRAIMVGVRDAADFVIETGGIELNRPAPVLVPPDVGPHSLVHLSPESISQFVQTAYDFVRSFYRVELEASEPIRKPHRFSLELLDQRGHKMKTVELTYPRYLPPGPAQP